MKIETVHRGSSNWGEAAERAEHVLTVMGLAVATGGHRLVLPLEASEIVIARTVAGARCCPAHGGLPVVDPLSGDYSTKSGR